MALAHVAALVLCRASLGAVTPARRTASVRRPLHLPSPPDAPVLVGAQELPAVDPVEETSVLGRPALPLTAATLSAVLLTGCAAGDDPPTASPAPTTFPSATAGATASPGAAAPTSPAASPTPASSPAPASSPSVRTIDVSYAQGQVTGTTGREEVSLGEPVLLRIASDVPEQVHVHGYDLERNVPAGSTVEVPLQADIPGVFEVELHESGRVLFQLRVA